MKGKKNGSSKKVGRPRGRPPKNKKPQKTSGKDVVRSHTYKDDVRVPINQAEAQRKERLLREKVTEITHLELQIKPLANQKRALGKEVKKLAEDVEQNSEEREMEVYKVKNYKTNLVQVVRADTDEVVDEHTMTEEERQRDVEEDAPGGPPLGDGGEASGDEVVDGE